MTDDGRCLRTAAGLIPPSDGTATLREREQFLSRLLRQGTSHRCVRSIAAYLIRIVQLLELTNKKAGECWANYRGSHRRRKAGRASVSSAYLADGPEGGITSPPVVVRRMVPFPPTAVQMLALGQETPRGLVGLSWLVQVAPPLVVRTKA
jgi:hypothetical protein